MVAITRKTLLYKTGVEYGEYAINHVLGCSHGCKYPCYAYLQKKRFGLVKEYEDGCQPKVVANAVELLESELERKRDKIKKVQLCFATDPFPYFMPDEFFDFKAETMEEWKNTLRLIQQTSLDLIKILNDKGILVSVLTKGILHSDMYGGKNAKENEYGITCVSLDDKFRKFYEPGSAPVNKRIKALKELQYRGANTGVSIEPYPTPNIIEQDINELLEAVGFVDKIVFGRLNYNKLVSQYKDSKKFYNQTAKQVIKFCEKNHIQCHIKEGTINE